MLLRVFDQFVAIPDLDPVYLSADKLWIHLKKAFYYKSRFVIMRIIGDRLSEVARADNDHLILLVQSEYRADLFIKVSNIVAVSLLSEASEII